MKAKRNPKHVAELVEVFVKLAGDRQLLNDFLHDLLTPAEQEALATRWQIIKQLARKVPQWEVSKSLGVGIATVTRGARALREQKGGFEQALRRSSSKSGR